MARKGTTTFILQRASAALLVPLVIWLIFSLVSHSADDFAAARDWLGAPLNAGLMTATLIVAALHMRIGVAEIVHDYIHGRLAHVLLALNTLFCLTLAIAVLWAAWTLSFAG